MTLNLPTCYYLGAQGPEGLEYDLASRFASQLGVRLKIYAVPNEAAIRSELASGHADIAAAQLTAGSAWWRVGQAATPYAQIPQLVVYRRDEAQPRDTLQLETARLAVQAGSAQEQLLARMKQILAPHLTWVETAPSSADPLEDVDSGQARYAIVDARTYSYAHHLYPDIRVGFGLPEKRPIQWIVRPRRRGPPAGGESLLPDRGDLRRSRRDSCRRTPGIRAPSSMRSCASSRPP